MLSSSLQISASRARTNDSEGGRYESAICRFPRRRSHRNSSSNSNESRQDNHFVSTGVTFLGASGDNDTGDAYPVFRRPMLSASGGTSAGSPQWAALLAISNSMRVANRKTRLSGANTVLYSLSKQSAAANFHPITADTNGSCGALCTASAGGDYVTRIGKSAAASLVNTLAAQYRSRFGLQWVGQLPRMESGELPTTEAEAVLAASRCAAAGF